VRPGFYPIPHLISSAQTTNRIGQIDDAFLSRTSVALTYETLTIGKQRRIWEGFLKKLGDERKDISLTDRAKKFLEGLDKDETTKNVPWNGREIRNGTCPFPSHVFCPLYIPSI
jgi:hypothetical protein